MMHYFATADTDIGNTKSTNQDSLLIKHASYCGGEVMLAVICDGMGGLSKGELASATVIKEFSKWFEEELPYELEKLDMNVIGEKWSLLLKELNIRIIEYGQLNHISLGTTFTGILMVNDKYVIGHVGDTRVYFIGNGMMQLTEDQTFVAREIKKGTMTPEQAAEDKRRNMLLQCVGASENLEPEIIVGGCMRGTYMICSDGFRHEITEQEMYNALNPAVLVDECIMHNNSRQLISLVKQRQEKDNISVILIRTN